MAILIVFAASAAVRALVLLAVYCCWCGLLDFFQASLARLHQLRFPSDLLFTRDGTAVVAAVRPAAHEPRQSPQSRVWRIPGMEQKRCS
jgi:hypothetical protein